MDQVLPNGRTFTVIHLVTQPNGEDWRIACMPNMVEFHSTPYHPHYPRTDQAQAVTCPSCKNTDAYRQMRKT